MSLRPRSLKYEYELYIESELEAYKDSVPRSVLLRIGDEAVSILAAQQQLALTELLLSEEVDRIIRKRLRLPVYRTWCRRRLNALAEFRRPERWGMTADAAVVRTVPVATSGHVLVAGFEEASSALFLAANGCAVTAIDPVEDVVERVLSAAVEVGLTTHLRGFVADLATWSPDLPLNALVCGANAFTTLPTEQRGRVLSLLQTATTAGGLHVVQNIAGAEAAAMLEQLSQSYSGWQTSVERGSSTSDTFLARKVA
ncbi:MAG: hypothetical protein WKG32_19625 [Gemmatimonadaceae bacterium]